MAGWEHAIVHWHATASHMRVKILSTRGSSIHEEENADSAFESLIARMGGKSFGDVSGS